MRGHNSIHSQLWIELNIDPRPKTKHWEPMRPISTGTEIDSKKFQRCKQEEYLAVALQITIVRWGLSALNFWCVICPSSHFSTYHSSLTRLSFSFYKEILMEICICCHYNPHHKVLHCFSLYKVQHFSTFLCSVCTNFHQSSSLTIFFFSDFPGITKVHLSTSFHTGPLTNCSFSSIPSQHIQAISIFEISASDSMDM